MTDKPQIELSLIVEQELVYRMTGKAADLHTTARYTDTINVIQQEYFHGFEPLYDKDIETRRIYVSTLNTIKKLIDCTKKFRNKEVRIEIILKTN